MLARFTVLFLGKTLYSHSASLHPTGINGISKLSGQPDKNAGEGGGGHLLWTSISSRGIVMLRKPELPDKPLNL